MIRRLRLLFPVLVLGATMAPLAAVHAQRLLNAQPTARPTIATAGVGL